MRSHFHKKGRNSLAKGILDLETKMTTDKTNGHAFKSVDEADVSEVLELAKNMNKFKFIYCTQRGKSNVTCP